MQRTNITTVLLLVSTSCIWFGCGGPSKAGLEARKDAYSRVDKVNTQIGYSQARQAFETGQLRKALKLITEAVDRYPQAAEYNLLHGRVLLELHRLDEARSAFEAALAVNDQQAEAYYFLGIIYQRWSEDEEAYEQYMKACSIDAARPQYLLASAETLVSLRRYDEADALVHENLRSFEHHPSFRHLLGQIAQLQGDPAAAARLYEEASILQPENTQLLEELACAQFAAEEFSGCLRTLQILASREYVFNAQLSLLNARCLVHTNQLLDARPLYKQLRTDLPHDTILWEESGWLAWSLEDWRGLRHAGLQASSLAPDSCSGWLLLGVADRAEGSLESAEKQLVKAVSCEDASTLAWVLLSRVRMQRGDDAGAAEAWSVAAEQDGTLANQMRVTSAIEIDG